MIIWFWPNLCVQDRVPFQYLIASAHWRQHILAVGPGVLIPRPETEIFAGGCGCVGVGGCERVRREGGSVPTRACPIYVHNYCNSASGSCFRHKYSQFFP